MIYPSSKYDCEVRDLKAHCEKLLQEMEKYCYEIDRIINGGSSKSLLLVCDSTSSDNVIGYSSQD